MNFSSRFDGARAAFAGLAIATFVATGLFVGPSAAHDETQSAARRRQAEVERAALAQADPTAISLPENETAEVTLRLLDDASGRPLPSLVRVTNVADGAAIRFPHEIHRGANWFSVAAESKLRLPQRKLRIEAIHGLDTERAAVDVDLTNASERRDVELRLRRFGIEGACHDWAGNTHLHLRGLSIAEMDRYLRLVPQTDGLDILFVSHLRRAVEDRDYTSNVLTAADLARLSTPNVQYGNGEEHRHNFGPGGQGYGHVMFLNIKQWIQPISIGPGIMKEGTDGLPLRPGLEAARRDGATVVWCHNRFGFEDVPSWLAERLDAQNIHDGGQTHGSYDETFYRYLNLGLRVPFSTGTDWFVYDFSRVFVPRRKQTTPAAWLRELAAGRTFITNGPLLDFSLGDAAVGDVLRPERPTTLRVRGRAVGRNDFRAIELVCNGEVLAPAASRAVDGHFTAEIDREVTLDGPGWYALRIPAEAGTNELEQRQFAHTSPIYVDYAGQRSFSPAAADALRAEMQRALESIPQEGLFADDAERERVLDVYREGLRRLEARTAEFRNRTK